MNIFFQDSIVVIPKICGSAVFHRLASEWGNLILYKYNIFWCKKIILCFFLIIDCFGLLAPMEPVSCGQWAVAGLPTDKGESGKMLYRNARACCCHLFKSIEDFASNDNAIGWVLIAERADIIQSEKFEFANAKVVQTHRYLSIWAAVGHCKVVQPED
jgi:hypothetical protein